MTLTVWAVKSAVAAILGERLIGDDLADIVALGRPVEVPPVDHPRRVYVGDVVNDTPQPPWEPSSQVRIESYVVPLLVDVVSYSGNDPAGYGIASGKVAAIVAGIERALGIDPSWGATCHNSGLALAAESTGPIPEQAGTGWRSGAILELHVQHRGR